MGSKFLFRANTRFRKIAHRLCVGASKWLPRLWPGNLKVRWQRRLVWVGFACFGLFILVNLMMLVTSFGLPDVSLLKTKKPNQITRILDRNGVLIGEFFKERRSAIPFERIPKAMVLSIMAAEDAEFYNHSGVDFAGILRVLRKGLSEGRITQGASTITQQLVKNALLSPERTITRKIREIILARKVESVLSKDEILERYLNLINFGHGRYGVQEAARFYFDKDASELTLAEAALLAGIPKSPSHLSPISHPEQAERRRQFVLDQLLEKRETHWPELSREEIEAAQRQKPSLVPWVSPIQSVPEVVPIVKDLLIKAVGKERALTGGFTVHTTIDMELQRVAREYLRKGLVAYDGRHEVTAVLRRRRVSEKKLDQLAAVLKVPEHKSALRGGKSYEGTVLRVIPEKGVVELAVEGEIVRAPARAFARYNPGDLPLDHLVREGARLKVVLKSKRRGSPALVAPALGPQGAVCVIDASSRHVLALVGGYEASSGFNRAVQAKRQPGSTFKPLLYALALKSRQYTPATIMIERRSVTDESVLEGEEVIVEKAPVNLRKALAKSVNAVALELINAIGPAPAAEFYHELGVTSELEVHPGLALGSTEVSVEEITNVYATFASGGRYAPPCLVDKIIGPDSEQVRLKHGASRNPLSPAEAYLTTSLMESVVKDGTGRRALALGRAVAGKTGTSDDCRDAWFIGYSPKVVTGVWVGYDDFRPLGEEESGTGMALPIWVNVMREVTDSEADPPNEFVEPEGLVWAFIDPETGLRAYDGMEDAVREIFLEGTVPKKFAPERILSDTDTGDLDSDDDPSSAGEPPSPWFQSPR